ncbi:aquaporin [Roseitalea porphyridii]|uniref:Aquaporin family protein n=1 Tax=Roseitalea porphyridii TaxID=1852022 RepID=A0A4P6V333_9HYPH|nr:MIP/aquaporin family protein [Roseitalea porphyridii]QBK31303.1 aquaporin family protein [Roseitalea porphyridii]
MSSPSQRLGAEFIGTAFLLAAVVGSGIMGDTLAAGNVAVALLANTIATGAILVVLITMLGPVSGAHFNPAVTLAFFLRGEIGAGEAVRFVLAQIAGGIVGVWAAHLMFADDLIQFSTTARTGGAQWFSEWVACFGLVFTILATLKVRPAAVPMGVGLYITSAYWFTASTSFANPAVTIARGLSDTFAGIRPADVPLFILMQLIGAACAVYVARWLCAGRVETTS